MDQPRDSEVTPSASTRSPDLPRTIGFLGATGIMAGIIIGSGIFQTPGDIAKEMGNPILILALWALGGVISLFGAATYAELATMYPHSGGVYVFLREGYGRCTAFVFGWTYMLISKPLAAAGIAVTFAFHLNTLLGVNWDERLTTCIALIVLTALNVRGTRQGAAFATFLTVIKVAALIGIVLIALALRKGAPDAFVAVERDKSFLSSLGLVMAAVLWTYDGWSDVGAVAGEVREPQRMLPRIYFVGTAAVTLLYIAVNAVYIWIVPLNEMANLPQDQTIAPLVMQRLLGPYGAMLVTALIVIATLGSTHGSIITGARISYAQARDGLLFRSLGRVHRVHQTPHVSLWVQCILACAAMIALETFKNLVNGFIFTMWIFYGLSAATIFIMRVRRPDAVRPYRCWGYPVVPALFILSSLAMTVMLLRDLKLTETLPWIGVLIGGIPVYYVWERFTRRGAP